MGTSFTAPSGATWSSQNGVLGGWTGGNGEEVHGMIVYNNTFINVPRSNMPIWTSLPRTYSGNVFENNLFYNCDSPDFSIVATHDYNHFINSGGTHSEANGTSAASGDPFVDYVNLNFALKAATTAGTSLSSPFNLDPIGHHQGSRWNLGPGRL